VFHKSGLASKLTQCMYRQNMKSLSKHSDWVAKMRNGSGDPVVTNHHACMLNLDQMEILLKRIYAS